MADSEALLSVVDDAIANANTDLRTINSDESTSVATDLLQLANG
jgi:hypothetical protein